MLEAREIHKETGSATRVYKGFRYQTFKNWSQVLGILGILVEQDVLGVFLDRVVSLIVVFFLGFIYSRLLLNDVSEEE
jgi:hypothetical protein